MLILDIKNIVDIKNYIVDIKNCFWMAVYGDI